MRAAMKFLGLAILTGMFLVGTTGVAGAADENATCVGTLASFFADEGLDDEVAMLQATADGLGVPFGALVQLLASERGTVDECLALVGF